VITTAGGDSCSVRIREAGFRDSLIRERNPLLGAPEHPNDPPGPGSLRAEVRSDSLHHPFIHIVDKAKGTSRVLCSGSSPRFSPDGRWIACIRWTRTTPWVLAIVGLGNGAVHTIEDVGQIEDFAWSPDSKRLAFTSMPPSGGRWKIGWIDVARKSVQVLATDDYIYAEFEDCEWAPDSRRFVVDRRCEYEHDDSVNSDDLWLFDIDGKPCRLTHTPRREKNLAGWVDNRRVRFQLSENGDGMGGLYVIELEPAPKPR
jgi:dipeptidyl aminopeptidase/acylaminoacyl peptidase